MSLNPSSRLCFPGGQSGSGAYSKEKELLARFDLVVRERPVDVFLFATYSVVDSAALDKLLGMPFIEMVFVTFVGSAFLVGPLAVFLVFRRRLTGRS
jgi:hypothetical protein